MLKWKEHSPSLINMLVITRIDWLIDLLICPATYRSYIFMTSTSETMSINYTEKRKGGIIGGTTPGCHWNGTFGIRYKVPTLSKCAEMSLNNVQGACHSTNTLHSKYLIHSQDFPYYNMMIETSLTISHIRARWVALWVQNWEPPPIPMHNHSYHIFN